MTKRSLGGKEWEEGRESEKGLEHRVLECNRFEEQR